MIISLKDLDNIELYLLGVANDLWGEYAHLTELVDEMKRCIVQPPNISAYQEGINKTLQEIAYINSLVECLSYSSSMGKSRFGVQDFQAVYIEDTDKFISEHLPTIYSLFGALPVIEDCFAGKIPNAYDTERLMGVLAGLHSAGGLSDDYYTSCLAEVQAYQEMFFTPELKVY